MGIYIDLMGETDFLRYNLSLGIGVHLAHGLIGLAIFVAMLSVASLALAE
jgi:hypothetical protein